MFKQKKVKKCRDCGRKVVPDSGVYKIDMVYGHEIWWLCDECAEASKMRGEIKNVVGKEPDSSYGDTALDNFASSRSDVLSSGFLPAQE